MLEWSAAMEAAFAAAKQSLLSATHLAHPTVGAELSVVVDASATHVGACLQQRLPGKKAWQPLGFFSKKLEAAQQKYSAFDRELFACFAVTSDTCWTAGGSPSSRTTSRSPMPWLGCLSCGLHDRPGSCPTWRSIHRTSATSPGQPMWWRILSPGVAVNVADVQPATGVSFHKMAPTRPTVLARCRRLSLPPCQ
jgi:hypothetical protein